VIVEIGDGKLKPIEGYRKQTFKQKPGSSGRVSKPIPLEKCQKGWGI